MHAHSCRVGLKIKGRAMSIKMVLLTALVAMFASHASAERRIALIVGNGNYAAVSPLDNPVNDATLIGDTLSELGFEVTVLLDARQIEMKRAIAQFGRDLRNGGPDTTGLFYYAGHGVQSMSTNYLLPVDITVQDEADFDILGVQADWVLRQMHSARNKTNIVILDACRNNPFEALASILDDGLAEMNAPTGTFLSYATAPGSVAADGLGANSPFTNSLVKYMREPGLPIEQTFKQVRIDVLDATHGMQTPWDASSLTDDFSFVNAVEEEVEDGADMEFWETVRDMRDPVQLMLYLRAYGDSEYADDAEVLLRELMEEELKPAANAETTAVAAAPQAPAPKAPGEDEIALIEKAQMSGQSADYQAYIDAFPDGTFVDLARIEFDAAKSKEDAAVAAAAEEKAPEPEVEVASRAAPAQPTGLFTFDTPITSGAEEIIGMSIMELIEGSPLFPPLEGLPDEVWKNKQCSECHQWERANLCEQGQGYLALNAQRSLGKVHPYGGSFKQSIRAWAAGGCN